MLVRDRSVVRPMLFRWLQERSLRQKMMSLNLFGVTVALLATFALFALAYYFTARQHLTDSAVATARLLAQNTAPMLVFGDQGAAQTLLASLDTQTETLLAIVYDRRGELFATWTHPQAWPDRVAIPPAPTDAGVGIIRRLHADRLEIIVPILVHEERVGTFFLRKSLRSIDQEIWRFMEIGLVLALSAIALTALLLHQLQLRALTPVFELAALAERVAREYDYRLRAPVQTDDEVGRLAHCFNQMLERIEIRERNLNIEIGERRAAECRLDRLAHYDSLTQLPNRHFFQKALRRTIEDAVANEQLAALMFIDLDNFKYVNDTAGHEAGDVLLKVAAKRLLAALRSSDMLCRLGGDEFAALLPRLGDIAQAQALAERLIATMQAPILIQGMEMMVGASIGIACCPTHTVEPAILLRQADVAMYAAKQSGKNACRLFDPSMAVAAAIRLTPVATLKN
ncbi:MAG: diguanylate cyclase [Candidatus Competibacteraceae bacterium]